MRIESRVVAVSWIPSEAVKGAMKAPFELGIAHYDEPLPDVLGDLEDWKARDLFRFANDLRAWIEVDDDGSDRRPRLQRRRGDRLDDHGPRVGLGHLPGRRLPRPPGRSPRSATAGCASSRPPAAAPACPAPRRVAKPPFVQYHAPTAWSTLALTIHADGRADWDVVGRQPLPPPLGLRPRRRAGGQDRASSTSRTGTATPSASNSPWGGEDSPALVAEVESALERQLSRVIMGEGKPKVRKLKAGAALTEQGEEADAIYLLLDGVIQVEVDGEEVADLGPGALIGERAVLEGGRRTATLIAVSPCKVAEARKVELDLAKLAEVSEGHRREERRRPREGPRARRAGLDPGARARLRPPRRQHVVRRAGPRRRSRRRLVLDAGTGLRGLGGAARRRAVPRRAPARPPPLGPHPGPAVLAARSTTTAPRCGCASRTRRTATRPSTCCAGPCRRPTSRSARRACAARWTFEGLEPGDHHVGGLRGAGPGDPAQGRAAPSATGSATGASAIAYLSDHGPRALGPGPDGWGPYHDAALALADGVDLLIHDAQHTAEELPAVVHFGPLGRRLRRCASASWPAPSAVLLFHHDPIRTDDEVDAIVASFAGRPVPVAAAAEGTALDL